MIMKQIKIYIALLAAAFAAVSCIPDNLNDEEGWTLNVYSPGAEETKATQNGVDALNENLINSVYYFFYRKADTPATATPKIKGFFAGLSFTGVSTWTVPYDVPVSAKTIVDDLFPVGTRECRVVVVANPPASIKTALEGSPTLTELRAMLLTAAFEECETQSNFVMVYDDLVEIASRTADVALTVDAKMKRVADKITITASISDGVQDPVTGWWIPRPADMKVEFYNGLNKANLAGDFAALKAAGEVADEDYFNSAPVGFTVTHTPTHSGLDTVYTARTSSPIYTYPMDWEFADRHEPYIIIELPWLNTKTSKEPGPGAYQSCYYKMMLNSKSMASNSWYNLSISLSVLGSFYKTAPTQEYLWEDYVVLDWKNAFSEENNVNAIINDARYLMVDQTSYVLDNQATWDIPFQSSHDCEIVNATYTTTNFAVNPAQTTSPASISGLTPACTIQIDGSIIKFSHALRNDISGGGGTYDVAPYTFTFTIRHKDNTAYSETVTIVQYPSIYIVSAMNSHSNSSGECYETTQMNKHGQNVAGVFGTVFVNNSLAPDPIDNPIPHNTSWGSYTYHNQGWMGLIGGDSYGGGLGSNHNGSMYVISTSTAPDLHLKRQGDAISAFSGAAVVIGDPREKSVNNLDVSGQKWSATCPAVYDGAASRKMTYYYPTGSDEISATFIAPKFRIASSWGTCNEMTYTNARRKCAAYQEDGYPAGRWRLPTEAEMQYIIKLSSDHVIPPLFGSISSPAYAIPYWCNNGYITTSVDGTTYEFHNNPNDNSEYSTRCVYDDWYWSQTDSYVTNSTYQTTGGRLPSQGTDPDYQTFVWGDMPR